MIDSHHRVLPAAEIFAISAGTSTANAQLFRADDDAAPCVLVFPALGTPARPYLRLAVALQSGGVHVLIADWRGMASSSVRASRSHDWSYLDLVDGEAESMFALARRELPNSSLHAVGHSLGGQVALLHAARYPNATFASLTLAASASPHYRAYPFPYRLMVHAFAWVVAAMVAVLNVFRGDWLRFGGKQGASLMREWSHFNRKGRLPPLGCVAPRWNPSAELAKVDLPIHVLTMRGDSFAPASAARALVELTASDAQYHLLERLPSGRLPDHFDWLREPGSVADTLVACVKAKLVRPGVSRPD